jgi:hypothetical protein
VEPRSDVISCMCRYSAHNPTGAGPLAAFSFVATTKSGYAALEPFGVFAAGTTFYAAGRQRGRQPMVAFGKSLKRRKRKRKTTAKRKMTMMMTEAAATQSDHRASPVESRQAQTRERGASRPSTDVGHDDQFKNSDIREFDLILLDLADCVRRTEIPLLAHDLSK